MLKLTRMEHFTGCRDILQNDTQHNDIQHNDTQHRGFVYVTLSVFDNEHN